jgi:DNA-binding PadR family transcriptional regulator
MDPTPHPLTDLAFTVLVSLKDHPLHGYALLKELRARTGRERLRTGTVYAALARLQDDGLVEEAPAPRDPSDGDDERRRYYRLTAGGLAAARAEAARLEGLLRLARDKDLLPSTGA